VREERLCSALFLASAVLLVIGCHLQQPNISGIWNGSMQLSWEKSPKGGPGSWHTDGVKLTLNQKGDAITGTLSAGGSGLPITSGFLSKGSLTFSANAPQGETPMELTFHGKVTGTSLTGTVDTTFGAFGAPGDFSSIAITGPLTLTKQ
jgi:hypothetical protein